jgi:DNA primase
LDSQAGGSETRHLKDRLFQIHEQITQRWQSALASGEGGQMARDYLARRGVAAEAVQLFRLGCAPDAWDDTVNWAKSKQHELPLVEQAGLILRKEGGDHFYDRFRGRLIFPICDEQGRVVGFSGRILSGDEKTAKYVNSPETPIFTKGKVMFGLDKSKRALLETHRAVICEGQLDLIACFMSGVKNVVAPQGTALTAEHTRILKRYVDEVVLCFDSDNAGQNAAVRSLDVALASGLAVRVATVPAPHDPDSFIKEFGGAAFAQLIENALDFFDYYLDRLCVLNDAGTDRGRRAIVQAMAEAVHKAGSDVLRDTYAQKTALRLGVAADAMRSEFKKGTRRQPVENGELEESSPPPARPPSRECWLLRVLLEKEEYVEWVAAHLEIEWLTSPVARGIVTRRLELADAWPGVAAWLAQLENAEWKNLITEVLADGRPIPDAEGLLKGSPTREGTLKNLRDEFIRQRLTSISQRLGMADLPEASQQELVAEKQHLLRLKKAPLTPRSDQA